MQTFTEENYLKAIYKLSTASVKEVSTNSIAENLDTKPSSVTDMVKKLADKELVIYKPYKGVRLTDAGRRIAVRTIRKHRLWEVFLVDHLDFKWDEVHPIAEELEHINSDELVLRLEKFLGYPKYDPHGDPIPDQEGIINHHKDRTLSDLVPGESGVVVGVKDHTSAFLQYLEANKLVLGTKVSLRQRFDFDNSMVIQANGEEKTISNQVGKNLYVSHEQT